MAWDELGHGAASSSRRAPRVRETPARARGPRNRPLRSPEVRFFRGVLLTSLSQSLRPAYAVGVTATARPVRGGYVIHAVLARCLRCMPYTSQAPTVDVQGKRAGLLDLKGRAKFDAWAAERGVSRETARQRNVALVRRLQRR